MVCVCKFWTREGAIEKREHTIHTRPFHSPFAMCSICLQMIWIRHQVCSNGIVLTQYGPKMFGTQGLSFLIDKLSSIGVAASSVFETEFFTYGLFLVSMTGQIQYIYAYILIYVYDFVIITIRFICFLFHKTVVSDTVSIPFFLLSGLSRFASQTIWMIGMMCSRL